MCSDGCPLLRISGGTGGDGEEEAANNNNEMLGNPTYEKPPVEPENLQTKEPQEHEGQDVGKTLVALDCGANC
jgi:hypothetical protein